jgi:head-tail adaptor
MANPKIGRMRHRVTLKKQSDAPSLTFSNETTYRLVKELWGELMATSGRSYYTTRNLLDGTTHTLTVRYSKHIDTLGENDTCVYCGRMFQILTSHIIDERNRFIMFELSEMGEESSFDS